MARLRTIYLCIWFLTSLASTVASAGPNEDILSAFKSWEQSRCGKGACQRSERQCN
jgi:hypothetical protein